MSELLEFLKKNWAVIIENKWLFLSMAIILLGLGASFGRFIFNKKIIDLEHKLNNLSDTEDRNKALVAENETLVAETAKLRERLDECDGNIKILAAKHTNKEYQSKYNVAKNFATYSK